MRVRCAWRCVGSVAVEVRPPAVVRVTVRSDTIRALLRCARIARARTLVRVGGRRRGRVRVGLGLGLGLG